MRLSFELKPGLDKFGNGAIKGCEMASKRGAIFDWDGVIVNSAAQHEISWERLARECDKILPEDHFKRGFGMKNEVIIPELLGWTSVPVEIRILSLRKEAIYRELVREQGMTALPGVEPWLRMLREEGIPCGIASSTHRENITTTLDVLGLEGFFSALVTAEDVQRGKPDPEVFLTTAQRLGVKPGNAVVFEDALVGIQAAQAARMRVVAVATTEPRERLAHSDWVVDRLDELSVAQLWNGHAPRH
jgi:beta-phosphoglucomutase family hydrolase